MNSNLETKRLLQAMTYGLASDCCWFNDYVDAYPPVGEGDRQAMQRYKDLLKDLQKRVDNEISTIGRMSTTTWQLLYPSCCGASSPPSRCPTSTTG